MDRCVFCKELLSNGDPVTTIHQKGFDGIRRASQLVGREIEVQPGQRVHTRCRQAFIRDSERPNKRKSETTTNDTRRLSLRSQEEVFMYHEHCLFCGTQDKYGGRKKEYKLIPVRTKDFQNSILMKCEVRGDPWAEKVKARIEFVHDLHAADAVYHAACDANFRTDKQLPATFSSTDDAKKARTGRPVDHEREEAFLKAVCNLQERDEEQITVYDLINEMATILQASECQPYSAKHMKEKLIDHFGDKIVITEINGKPNVVTFREKAASILTDFFHQTRTTDAETEKICLVKAAANLIKTDIKCVEQSKDIYPTSVEMSNLDSACAFVPESLRTLLDILFVGGDTGVKVASVGQAIMQATRPRVLIAPLQLGLGVQMHSHFASRFLNETLHKHGFCCSYSEVQRYERCAAVQRGVDIPGFIPGSFIQYSADNVDHNIRTLDGTGTFHGMGIVANVTPKLDSASLIKRVTVTADDISKVGRIQIRYYSAPREGMKNLIYKKFELPSPGFQSPNVDLLWELAFLVRPQRPGWSGFMQMVSKGEHPGQASVIILPMIDMNPSDLSCINSTLHFVVDHAKQYNVVPVVTFDQPLWFKATGIVENEAEGSPLKAVVMRLGGFHTLMSFLGCIGHLMQGTGLKDILEKIYASNTVAHIMSGKAVARALRAHFLLDTVLTKLLLYEALGVMNVKGSLTSGDGDDSHAEEDSDKSNETPDTDDEDEWSCPLNQGKDNPYDDASRSIQDEKLDETLSHIVKMYDQLVAGEISLEEVESSPMLASIKGLLDKTHQSGERTHQLWRLYMKMISIIRKFIASDRTSDWTLQLDAMNEMLPFLAATGHNLYTKSLHIYLQKMTDLQVTNPTVYDNFSRGLHAVRRSDRFWAGLSPDLVIEQVLMRSLKTTGGLTRGRGMTEMQRTVWALSSPVSAEVNCAMQNLTSISYSTSEQHKDLSVSRKKRDQSDADKLFSFLEDKSPFRKEPCLRNIVSGVEARNDVDVDRVEEIGERILQEMEEKQVTAHSFRKKDQVKTMTSKSSISIDGQDVNIDPLLLFQRLVLISTQKESLQEAFKYELCGYPPALFEKKDVLLKANKPALANAIWDQAGDLSEEERRHLENDAFVHVLDGGALLHKVPWEIGQTYGAICQKYVSFVRKFRKPVIVFDGYESGPTPKDGTHTRRAGGASSINIQLTDKLPLQSKKEDVLANPKNKQRFINLLGRHLECAGYEVHHAKGDADVMIVNTALEIALHHETIIVGSDTDLLILLCHHTTKKHQNIFFEHQRKQGSPVCHLHIQRAQKTLGKVSTSLLFIHALLGCDTTSRLFGHGKASGISLMKKPTFLKSAQVFNKTGVTQNDIIVAGEKAILCIYNAKPDDSLNKLRHQRYQELLMIRKQTVHPKSLPPTEAAAKYHSLRVYHQVQAWKGVELDPTKWGWKVAGDILVPIATDLEAGPQELLNFVRCKCETGCHSKRCGCRAIGLPCNSACTECRGVCENVGDIDDETSA